MVAILLLLKAKIQPHVSQFFLVSVLALGTMALDVRIGLYDDPPNKDTVKMIEATKESGRLVGRLSRGLEGLLFRFGKTPTFWKFCEAQDTVFGIGQEIVDKKVMELKKMAEEGDVFEENEGKNNSLRLVHLPLFPRVQQSKKNTKK